MAIKQLFVVGLTVLLRAYVGAADAGPQRVSNTCSPETSATSACLWTGNCPVGGCAEKCIVNQGLTQSYDLLTERAVGVESHLACPDLAFWVNKMVAITRDFNGRRLQSQDELWTAGAPGHTHSAPFSLVQSDAMRRGMHRLSHGSSLRHILNFEAYAPGPSDSFGGAGFDEILPKNECPTAADFEEAKIALQTFATTWRQVFESDARGEEVPADLQSWAPILEAPNRFGFLIKMFEDPDAAEEYIATKCTQEVVQDTEGLLLSFLLEPEEVDLIDSDLRMVQCVDNFGALSEAGRNFISVVQTCSPAFGQIPDCFSLGFTMITTTECAQAYARMFNVSDVANLVNIANTVDGIHTACSGVTTEADCLDSKTPALTDIERYHDNVPIRNPLDLSPTTTIDERAIDPRGPVCLEGVACAEPPAPPPGSQTVVGLPQPPATLPGEVAPAGPPAPGPVPVRPSGPVPLTPADVESSSAQHSGLAGVGRVACWLAAATAVAAFAPALLG